MHLLNHHRHFTTIPNLYEQLITTSLQQNVIVRLGKLQRPKKIHFENNQKKRQNF